MNISLEAPKCQFR